MRIYPYNQIMLNFLTILITFAAAHAVSVVDISHTGCVGLIRKAHGLNANKICIENKKIWICESRTSPPGAEIPISVFTNEKKEQKLFFKSPLSICKQFGGTNEVLKISDQCFLADHPLFTSIGKNMTLNESIKKCFCRQDNKPFLSLCKKVGDGWFSTAELDTSFVLAELNTKCDAAIEPNYQIACYCKKHFSSDHGQYITCLRDQFHRFEIDVRNQKYKEQNLVPTTFDKK